jgi:hypothetical protein
VKFYTYIFQEVIADLSLKEQRGMRILENPNLVSKAIQDGYENRVGGEYASSCFDAEQFSKIVKGLMMCMHFAKVMGHCSLGALNIACLGLIRMQEGQRVVTGYVVAPSGINKVLHPIKLELADPKSLAIAFYGWACAAIRICPTDGKPRLYDANFFKKIPLKFQLAGSFNIFENALVQKRSRRVRFVLPS